MKWLAVCQRKHTKTMTSIENNVPRVFLDTNVIIDGLILRDYSYQPSRDLIRLIITGKFQGYICAKQITDIDYIFRKYVQNKDVTMEYIKRLTKFFNILPLLEGDILSCLNKKQKDFEDAILAEVAKVNMVPIFITNNVDDYQGWPLMILTPEQFLKMHAKE